MQRYLTVATIDIPEEWKPASPLDGPSGNPDWQPILVGNDVAAITLLERINEHAIEFVHGDANRAVKWALLFEDDGGTSRRVDSAEAKAQMLAGPNAHEYGARVDDDPKRLMIRIHQDVAVFLLGANNEACHELANLFRVLASSLDRDRTGSDRRWFQLWRRVRSFWRESWFEWGTQP